MATAQTGTAASAGIDRAGPNRPRPRAWLPSPWVLVALLVAGGLVLCAYCEDRSRATLAPDPWIYWLGLIVIVAPIAYRVTAFNISSLERTGLVVLEGVALYVARMMRDPFGYSLTDEFSHAWNLQTILTSHHLYHADPLLPISAHFPGLEAATSALATLTGMSSWGSGLLLIGAARVTIMLALYVMFSAVSRSARAGALGAVLFAANSNYLLWEGQFAYESLALPLMIVVLAAIAERHRAAGAPTIRAWGVVAAITIIAIVPTHHLTAYVLIAALWLLCIGRLWLPWPFSPISLRAGPPIWPFALLATTMTFAWLVVVATQTVGYLSPEISSAFLSTLRTVTGEAPPRALFSNAGNAIGSNNLLSEEAVSFLEPALLLIAVPFGLRAVWKGKRPEPFVWVLAALTAGYFLLTAMRVVPSAWEIANRGAEFMFIGIAFIAGAAAMPHVRSFWRRPLARMLVGLAAGLCVVGGAIAGWPANSRLAHPTQIAAPDGTVLYSESEAVGRWFASQPAGQVIAGDADAMAIALYGHHMAFSGYEDNADPLLSSRALTGADVRRLLDEHVRYVVVDRRKRSQDSINGLYVNMLPPAASVDADYPPAVLSKWVPYGARIYDSGDVVVFDLDRRR